LIKDEFQEQERNKCAAFGRKKKGERRFKNTIMRLRKLTNKNMTFASRLEAG